MSTSHPKKPIYKSLYAQVLFAVVVGVLLGHFYPSVEAALAAIREGNP